MQWHENTCQGRLWHADCSRIRWNWQDFQTPSPENGRPEPIEQCTRQQEHQAELQYTCASRTFCQPEFLSRIRVQDLFLSLFYGIMHGRFDFNTRKINLNYPNLPAKFNGLKIVQISDFHIRLYSG